MPVHVAGWATATPAWVVTTTGLDDRFGVLQDASVRPEGGRNSRGGWDMWEAART